MVLVDVKDPKSGNEKQYYIEQKLKDRLDRNVKKQLEKNDEDYVMAVDGEEGSGKSTFAFQIAKYIDPTLDLSRICFSGNDFYNAIKNAKKGQAVVYDEAFTGLSSRSSLSKINAMLVSLMMQMRQKNLFVVIVLPTFYLLDKYAALWRTKSLIHVYKRRVSGNRAKSRGFFKVFGREKKKKLFLEGKKDYSYHVKTKFKGRFYGKFALGDDETEKEYRKKKEKALEEANSEDNQSQEHKWFKQRNKAIYALKNEANLGYREVSDRLRAVGFELSYVEVHKSCKKVEEELQNSGK